MISAQVIKGVEELLQDRGLPIRNAEPLGDAVARAFGISAQQAERLLDTLHDGGSVEEAARRADIDSKNASHSELLNALARKIGATLGRIAG